MAEAKPGRRNGALRRAFSTGNARLYFSLSLLSWTGMWMQRIAVAWLAWEMTHSPFSVGMVAFTDLAPAVLCSPVAGALADRLDRVRLTTLTQGLMALQAMAVAGLTALGVMDIVLLLVLSLLGGAISAFAQPARQAIIPGLLPREDLPAAVAVNSLVFNVARFLGPGIAGVLIAWVGVPFTVALNALAYLLATVTMPFLCVAAAERRGHAATGSVWTETVAGLAYVARHPGLGPIFAFSAMACLTLRGVQEILPPYVERLFGRGAESLAVLTAAIGIGALGAGLTIASRDRLEGTMRLAILAVSGQAVVTALFVATSWFPFAVLCALLMGAGASMHGIAAQTLMHNAADPAMRGRVLALWGLTTRAFPAAGALVLGLTAERLGLRLPTLAAALLGLAAVAWGWSRLPVAAASLEAPPRR